MKRELCLQQTRNSFTRKLMVVVTFQIKHQILKKLLNFEAIFGSFLEILTKMLHGSTRSEKGSVKLISRKISRSVLMMWKRP